MHTMNPFSSMLYDSIVLSSCNILPNAMSILSMRYESKCAGHSTSGQIVDIPEYMSFCCAASQPFSCDILSFTCPICDGVEQSVKLRVTYVEQANRQLASNLPFLQAQLQL